MRPSLISFLAAISLPLIAALAPSDQIQDADTTQSGYFPAKGISLPLIQDPSFGNLWTTPTNGGTAEQFYAKPLVYTPASTGRQVVITASEMNWVYIMDAVNGTMLVSRQLGRPFLVTDLGGCNDIGGYIGITGTPIIDPTTDTIYLFSKSYKDMAPGGATGYLNGVYRVWALSAIDLSTRPGFPVVLDGHPADNDLGKYFHGGTHLQRPSAHLQNGILYGGFAGHCDQYNYTGWIAGIDKTSGEVKAMFSTEAGRAAPPQDGTWNGGGGGAGIWMGGFGFSTDNANRMFYVTGNGRGHENLNFAVSGKTPPGTLEEAIVNMAVDPLTGKVKPQDFFQPYEYLSLDAADKDFGSGGLALLDPGTFNGANAQRLGVTVGKNGKIYVANVDNLGGYRLGPGGGDKIVQTISTPGGGAVFGGIGSYPGEGGYFYVTPIGYNTVVFKFGRDLNGNAVFTQVATTSETSAGRVGAGVPTITSLDGTPGSAILWLTDPDNGLRAWKAVPENGQMIRIPLPPTAFVSKFQRPVFGDRKIYLSTTNGQIICLGSPVALPLSCSSPVDFGDVLLGSVKTLQVTCTANIDLTSLAGVVVQNTKYFRATNGSLPAGPLAKGSSFSFPVYMNLTQTVIADTPNTTVPGVIPGPVSGALNILTNNGVSGFSSSQPISLSGVLVSNSAILQLTPSEVSFGGVVVGSADAVDGITSSMFMNNLGKQPLKITGYAYTLDELADPNAGWVTIQPSPADPTVWTLGDGFTAKLPALGTVLQGGDSLAVQLSFNPSTVGDYSLIMGVQCDIGGPTYKTIVLAGVAAEAPIGILETSIGGGSYTNSTTIDFGTVFGGSSIQARIRLSNPGGSALTVTKSKPPEGTELFALNPHTDLHEGTHILPGQTETAIINFEPVPRKIANQLPHEYNAVWTLNTDGQDFGGPYAIAFHGTVLTPQLGPLMANGSAIYRHLGCYKDSTSARIEPHAFVYPGTNDNGLCQTACHSGGFAFAGTEYRYECYCGNFIPNDALLVDDALCALECPGDAGQICGGEGGYASFWYDVTRYDPGTRAFDGVVGKGVPHTVLSVGEYIYQGCYTDAATGRTLTQTATNGAEVDVAFCAGFCAGFLYFGVEYGRECFCGNSLAAGSSKVLDGECNMVCGADEFAYCGAGNRLGLYQRNSTVTIPATTTSTPPPVVISTTPTPAPPTGATNQNYTYLSCWSDTDLGNRTLQGKTVQDPAHMSPAFCHTFCAEYAYFGLEYGYECWCGNTVRQGSEQRPEAECRKPCPGVGGAAQWCGDGYRLNLYHNNNTPLVVAASTTTVIVPVPTPTTPPNLISTYLGCYPDNPLNRTLRAKTFRNAAVTIAYCEAACVPYGAYFGVEYTNECFCGDTLLVAKTGEAGCNMPCAGAPGEICGGANRIGVFVYNGNITTPPPDVSPTTTSSVAAVPTPPAPAPPPLPLPAGDPTFAYLGCYTDSVASRSLPRWGIPASSTMTIAKCLAGCTQFEYAGLEYGVECWCGDVLAPGSVVRGEGECGMVCAGDGGVGERCGAGNRLSLFRKRGV